MKCIRKFVRTAMNVDDVHKCMLQIIVFKWNKHWWNSILFSIIQCSLVHSTERRMRVSRDSKNRCEARHLAAGIVDN